MVNLSRPPVLPVDAYSPKNHAVSRLIESARVSFPMVILADLKLKLHLSLQEGMKRKSPMLRLKAWFHVGTKGCSGIVSQGVLRKE